MAVLHRSKHYVSSMPTLEELQKSNKDLNDWTDILEAKIKQFEQDPKVIVEFNRYKQDCRKKALEMAHDEWSKIVFVSNGGKGGEYDVLTEADKYYKWLISIPE